MIINGITEAPIIKGVNKFMGGIFATINIIFIIFLFIVLGYLSIFIYYKMFIVFI